jgi:T5SS/PEP-CTERM-associated repeat protein
MVNLTADRIDSDLFVPGDEVTLSLGQADYTLTGMCSSSSINISSGGSLTLSNGDVLAYGSVRIKGGLAPELLISSQSSLQIDADDDGSGSLMAGTPNGNALVQVEMGASLTSPNSTVLGSTAGTNGELSVDGAFVGGDVEVGDNGDGELFVDDDGFVAVDQLIAGKGAGSGIITVDGGRLDADEVILSDGSSSTLSSLTASNMGKLNFNSLTVGGAAGTTGSVTLSDSDLDLKVMIVGRDGVGDVEIGAGSTVNKLSRSGNFDLGLQSGSFGAMKIDGAQTEFAGHSLIVGDAGEGDLRISGGSVVDVDRVFVSLVGPGYFEVDGASTLNARHFDWGQDATVVLDGILLVSPNTGAPKRSAVADVVLRTDTLSVRGNPDVEVDSVAVADGGVVIGSGTFPFGLTNGGVLNPGDAAETPGQLTIGGDYVQTPDGILEIEISGSGEAEFDRLIVGGKATLSGRLRISLIGGFVPENGQEFEIVQAASVTGELGPIEAEGIRVDLVVDGTSAKLVVLSSVANERQGDLPVGFALHQSVPNPFNARTTISYDLPTPAPVRLIVFDGLGREIRLLESGLRTAGRHDVHFDAGPLPSGTYFYRLEADGRALSGRMVLLR